MTVATEARPCRSCNAPIYDLRHALTGRMAPIDVEPVLLGNIVIDLEAGAYRLVGTDVNPPAAAGTRWQSHFRSCPQAESWRANR